MASTGGSGNCLRGHGQGPNHRTSGGKDNLQGVDPCHQAGLPGQGREGQVPGGDLPFSLAIKESEPCDFSPWEHL